MIVKRHEQRNEFLKEPLSKHYGQLIMFDDNTTAIIVGEHEFKELSLNKYSEFVARVIEMEQELDRVKKQRDDIAVKLQEARLHLQSLKEAEMRRTKLTDRRVQNTLRYKATRFAIRLQAAANTDEALGAIDHAVNQMTEFVRRFCEMSDDKAIYDPSDFDIPM